MYPAISPDWPSPVDGAACMEGATVASRKSCTALCGRWAKGVLVSGVVVGAMGSF